MHADTVCAGLLLLSSLCAVWARVLKEGVVHLLGKHSPSRRFPWGRCLTGSRRRRLQLCCLPAADEVVLRRLECMQVRSTVVVSVLRHPGACTPREKGLERGDHLVRSPEGACSGRHGGPGEGRCW